MSPTQFRAYLLGLYFILFVWSNFETHDNTFLPLCSYKFNKNFQRQLNYNLNNEFCIWLSNKNVRRVFIRYDIYWKILQDDLYVYDRSIIVKDILQVRDIVFRDVYQ